MVLDAGSGVKSELEKSWDYIQDLGLPCLLFINGLDKERADFLTTYNECCETMGLAGAPLAFPVGQEKELSGIVDLIQLRNLTSNTVSPKIQEEDLSANLKTQTDEIRRQLIEKVAETNDQLVEKYLTEGDLSSEEIVEGLTFGTLEGKLVPVLCGSALHNIGNIIIIGCDQ